MDVTDAIAERCVQSPCKGTSCIFVSTFPGLPGIVQFSQGWMMVMVDSTNNSCSYLFICLLKIPYTRYHEIQCIILIVRCTHADSNDLNNYQLVVNAR